MAVVCVTEQWLLRDLMWATSGNSGGPVSQDTRVDSHFLVFTFEPVDGLAGPQFPVSITTDAADLSKQKLARKRQRPPRVLRTRVAKTLL